MRTVLAIAAFAIASPALAQCPSLPAGDGWNDTAAHQAVMACQQREIASATQLRALQSQQLQLQNQVQALELQRQFDLTFTQPRF